MDEQQELLARLAADMRAVAEREQPPPGGQPGKPTPGWRWVVAFIAYAGIVAGLDALIRNVTGHQLAWVIGLGALSLFFVFERMVRESRAAREVRTDGDTD